MIHYKKMSGSMEFNYIPRTWNIPIEDKGKKCVG